MTDAASGGPASPDGPCPCGNPASYRQCHGYFAMLPKSIVHRPEGVPLMLEAHAVARTWAEGILEAVKGEGAAGTDAATGMLARFRDLLHGIEVLARAHLGNEVAALGRILYEVAITSAFIGSDVRRAKDFIASGVFAWHKHLREMRDNHAFVPVPAEQQAILDAELALFLAEYGEQGYTFPNAKALAEATGQLFLHDHVYRYFCAADHCDNRTNIRAASGVASGNEVPHAFFLTVLVAKAAIEGLAGMLGAEPPVEVVQEYGRVIELARQV